MRILFMTALLLVASQVVALAQQRYSEAQLRIVRQIASAGAMADLCSAGISRARIVAALRSVGLTEVDFESPSLRDDRAKQRIALMNSYEELSMTIVGRQAALERQCSNLVRMYGPRGIAVSGLAIVAGR